MIQLHLSRTEIEAIERAFEIAFATGQMPDPNQKGDAVRIFVLRDTLRNALAVAEGETWAGRMKAQAKQRE